MKPGIHPELHKLTLVMTNGSEFVVDSVSAAGRLQLDSDKYNHQAWTGVLSVNAKASQVAKFNNRFASIGSLINEAK